MVHRAKGAVLKIYYIWEVNESKACSAKKRKKKPHIKEMEETTNMNDFMGRELSEDTFSWLIMEAVKMSKMKTKIINPVRYREILQAKDAFDELLQNDDHEKSTLKFHHAFSSASICAETDMLEVHDMARLSAAAEKANTMEIIPLTNGKVSISFTFQNALIPID